MIKRLNTEKRNQIYIPQIEQSKEINNPDDVLVNIQTNKMNQTLINHHSTGFCSIMEVKISENYLHIFMERAKRFSSEVKFI
jgi:hypothetical protein